MFSSQAASLQEHKSCLIFFCIFCLALNILPHNAFTIDSCKAVDFSWDWQKNAGCKSSAYSAHQGRAELKSLRFNRYRPNSNCYRPKFNCYRPKAPICKVSNRQWPHNQPSDLASIGMSKHSDINIKSEEAREYLGSIWSSILTLILNLKIKKRFDRKYGIYRGCRGKGSNKILRSSSLPPPPVYGQSCHQNKWRVLILMQMSVSNNSSATTVGEEEDDFEKCVRYFTKILCAETSQSMCVTYEITIQKSHFKFSWLVVSCGWVLRLIITSGATRDLRLPLLSV